jgi:hypothetical protein
VIARGENGLRYLISKCFSAREASELESVS